MVKRPPASNPTVEEIFPQSQVSRSYSADICFINAPSTFAYTTPISSSTTIDPAHRRKNPRIQPLNDEYYREFYDPTLDAMYRRQARNHGTRSPDSSPPPEHSRSNNDEVTITDARPTQRTATEPRTSQQTSPGRTDRQSTRTGSSGHRSELNRIRPLTNTNYFARTHGMVPNVTPRRTDMLPSTVRDIASRSRQSITRRTTSSEPSSIRTNEATAASGRPAQQGEGNRDLQRRPERTPRSRPQEDNQASHLELGLGSTRFLAPRRSAQGLGRGQVATSIVPPGDYMHAMRSGTSLFPLASRTPNPRVPSLVRTTPAPLPLPRVNPFLDVDDDYRLPPIVHSAFQESNERSTPTVQASRLRGNVLSSQPNRSAGSFARSNATEKPMPGNRKRPLPVENGEDDSGNEDDNDDSLPTKGQGDPTDGDEDEEETGDSDTDEGEDKDSSSAPSAPSADKEPPQKKTKIGIKKTRKRKANPKKRRTKARINHGELEERDDGSIWFRADENAPWEPTVRHEPNRAAMIADARRDPVDATRDRSYDVTPAGDLTDANRTSYLHSHRHWFCRQPHDWHHPTLDPIFYRFERGDRPFRQDTIGPLRWRGNIVLNNNNLVISDYPDMPLTLSSKIEGWRMEAIMRLDDRISAEDFRDRMPSRKNGQPPQVASALGNHRSRFRETNGLASWDARDGSKGYTEAIRGKLSQEQRDKNTTEGFDRLSPKTLKAIREANRENAKGAYSKRAGLKLLTEEERRKRAEGKKPTRSNINLSKKTAEAPKAQPSTATQSQPSQTRQTPENPSEDNETEEEQDETEYDGDEDESAL